jgi:Electron transfer DM13
MSLEMQGKPILIEPSMFYSNYQLNNYDLHQIQSNISFASFKPLFTSNTINEPLPTAAAGVNKNAALHDYQKFVSMNDQDRSNAAKQMSQKEINMVMIGAGQINNTINESTITTGTIQQQQQQQSNGTTARSIMTGSFIGAGDGFHNAEGLVRVIPLGDGNTIIRLENFKSTNGPNVHLYLATDKAASNFVHLGRLKANNGNQNYSIPHGTDLAKYNMALIWCKDFSVLFGSAQLKA